MTKVNHAEMTFKNSCLVVIVLVTVGIASSCTVVPLQDAKDAVYASKYVYEDKYGVGSYIPNTGFEITKVYFTTNKEFKVIVAKKGHTTMIVFRGTMGKDQLVEQIRSGFEDLTAKAPDTEFAAMDVAVQSFVNNGFQKLLVGLTDELTDNSRKYIITGHSLGGSFADLMALYATAHTDKVKVWDHKESSLITFGQPRVGGRKFAELHDSRIPAEKKLRFIYGNDIVPHLPGRNVLLNVNNKADGTYMHHSREIWIAKRKDMINRPSWRRRGFRSWFEQRNDIYVKFCKSMDTMECSNRLKLKLNIFSIFKIATYIQHHQMDHYINSIKNPPRFFDKYNNRKYTWESASC